MVSMPPEVRGVFDEWANEFSETIWPRFRLLIFAAIEHVALRAKKMKLAPRLRYYAGRG